jgi:hypothetical protein
MDLKTIILPDTVHVDQGSEGYMTIDVDCSHILAAPHCTLKVNSVNIPANWTGFWRLEPLEPVKTITAVLAIASACNGP